MVVFTQNNCGYVAGYNCASAPVICDLNCLQGFEGTLLSENSQIIIDNLPSQPRPLCNNGGTPQNMSWFAFIAGSNYAKITITPFNCENFKGIQAGMFADCDFTDDVDGTGFPITSEYIDCEAPILPTNGPVTLESNNLISGQTYYFYVDGFDADVCSYKVTVDKADQAGSIADLKQFDQSNDTIGICPKTKFSLGVEAYPLEIKFFWKVKSPGNYYTYSNYTPLDTQVVDFIFDSLGTYDVSMYAYNGCDATDTIRKTIIVRPYADEKFADVFICENRFPYAGPQIEDPNKDGVPGWQGPNIGAPGLNKHTVYLTTGCQYEQEIDVKAYALQAPAPVILADCAPFDFHGYTVNSNVKNIPITIQSGDKNGCDSLISLDAYILDVQGNLQQLSCVKNAITIGFNQSNISAPSGYKLTYIWKDQNGNVLVDNDSDPTNIEIKTKMMVLLEITLDVLGKKCAFSFAPINVDPALQLPPTPLVQNWDVELCEGSTLMDYEVTNIAGITYTWTASNGAKIQGLAKGSKVTVDFSALISGASAQLCVEASNVCGVSPMTCLPITVLKKPVVNFSADAIEVCQDSVLTVNHQIDDPSYLFKWTFDQATLLAGSSTKAGPNTLKYTNAGNYGIQLYIQNKECVSEIKAINVNVVKSVEASIIGYVSFADKIILNWTAVACAKQYKLFIDGVLITSTSNLQYELTGLKPGQSLTASIEVDGDGVCACGLRKTDLPIKTLSCTEFSLAIDKLSSTLICEDEWANPVQLSATFSNPNNRAIKWSGPGVDASGVVIPNQLGKGTYWMHATIEDMDCIYSDSIQLTLLQRPDVVLKNFDPECFEDLTGAVQVISANPSQNLDYIIDGDRVNGPMIDNISIGNHQIEVIDVNKCKLVKNITINPPVYPAVDINGDESPIYDNQKVTLTLNDKNSELNLIDSIEWYINGALFCSGNCQTISFPSMAGGQYTHQIFIYYKNCIMEKSFDFFVKESPKLYFSNIFNTSSSIEANRFFNLLSNDESLKVSEVNIYSRWGDLVFSKKDFIAMQENPLWDGTFNGQALMPGVYVLQVSYVNEKGILISIHKDITLIK